MAFILLWKKKKKEGEEQKAKAVIKPLDDEN